MFGFVAFFPPPSHQVFFSEIYELAIAVGLYADSQPSLSGCLLSKSSSPKDPERGVSQLLDTSSSFQPGWKSTPSIHLDLAEDSSQEFERLKALLSQSEQKLDSKALILKMELLKDQAELEHMEKEVRTQKKVVVVLPKGMGTDLMMGIPPTPK